MWNNQYNMIYIQDYKKIHDAIPMSMNGFYHMWETSSVLAPHYDLVYNKYNRSADKIDTPQTITIKMISSNIDRENVYNYINKIKNICYNNLGKPEKIKMFWASHNLQKDDYWYSEVFLNGDIKVDYDINKVIITFTFLQYDSNEYFDYYKLNINNPIIQNRIKKPYYENKNLASYYNGAENAQIHFSLQIKAYNSNIRISPLLIMRCISDPSIFRNLTIDWVRNKQFLKSYYIGDWIRDMRVPNINSFKSVHDRVAARVIGVGIDFESGMISLFNIRSLTESYRKLNKILEDKSSLDLSPLSITDLAPQDWEFGNNGMWITSNLKWELRPDDYITFKHKGSATNAQYGFEAYAIYRTRRF